MWRITDCCIFCVFCTVQVMAGKEIKLLNQSWLEGEREREICYQWARPPLFPSPHSDTISHPLNSLHKSHCSPTHKMVWTLHHPFVVVYTSSVISPAAASHSTINRALTKHQHTHSTQGTQGTTKLINFPYCPGNLQPFHTEGGDMVHFHQWPNILYAVHPRK